MKRNTIVAIVAAFLVAVSACFVSCEHDGSLHYDGEAGTWY